MLPFLRVAKTAVSFGYFWLGGSVLGAVVLPVVSRGAKDENERIRRCQRFVRGAIRHYHRVVERLDLGEFYTREYGEKLPDGPCVVVANHPTLLDVTLFLAEHDDICAVVKGELFRGPFVGRLLRQCGHIDAGRGTNLDGAIVVKRSMDRLEAGLKVLVFPEGTRSPVDDMHPFKRGAFDLALRAKVPLVVATIRCDPPTLMKGQPWWRGSYRERFRLRLTPLEVMDWRPWEGNSRLFRKQVQALIRQHVDAWHREPSVPAKLEHARTLRPGCEARQAQEPSVPAKLEHARNVATDRPWTAGHTKAHRSPRA
jgi:1-acyl-sn-glycerol-3-phosphate acyltransferase